MLTYLLNCLRPDIVNATWQLSKVMDGANPAVLLEMDCMIKYALIEPNGSKIEPRNIICFSNINYAGNPIVQRSVSGFTLYVLDVLVSSNLMQKEA